MSYVFDSSSIYLLLGKGKISILGGNYTTFLAKFELGNIVWKEVLLHRRISEEEGLRLISFISKLLSAMNLEDIDSVEVEKVAVDYGITFYDASYVWLAMSLDLPLVSDDIKLRNSLKDKKKLKVLSSEDIKMGEL